MVLAQEHSPVSESTIGLAKECGKRVQAWAHAPAQSVCESAWMSPEWRLSCCVTLPSVRPARVPMSDARFIDLRARLSAPPLRASTHAAASAHHRAMRVKCMPLQAFPSLHAHREYPSH